MVRTCCEAIPYGQGCRDGQRSRHDTSLDAKNLDRFLWKTAQKIINFKDSNVCL